MSRPVLTLSPAKSQVLEGTWVTFHCEVQRGSPPILYKFYHEYVPMGSSSTPSTGRASYGFSLTAEHSGNYYCTAENSFFGPQRSEAVSLSILGKPLIPAKPIPGQILLSLALSQVCANLPVSYHSQPNTLLDSLLSKPRPQGASSAGSA